MPGLFATAGTRLTMAGTRSRMLLLRMPSLPPPPPLPPAPQPLRPLSTSAVLGKSRAKSRISRRQRKLAKSGSGAAPAADDRVPLEVAWRALWAASIATPQLPFKVDVRTKASDPHELNVLRGRLNLPKDPRTTAERFLVLAHTDFPVGKAALRLRDQLPPGMLTVIPPDLFRRILSGEVSGYTKVLSDTHVLPAVNKQLARFLGPKGLMPNLRRGTALEEPEQLQPAIQAAQGAMDWRTDRAGNVPMVVARAGYSLDDLRTNLLASLLTISQQVGAAKINSDVASGHKLVMSFHTNAAFRASSLRKLNDNIKRVTLTVPGAPGFQVHVQGTFDPATRTRLEEEYQEQVHTERAEQLAAIEADARAQTEAVGASPTTAQV